MEVSNQTKSSSDFVKVPKRKAAKRKAIQPENAEKNESTSMEVSEETAVDRPAFPPIKREKLENGVEIRKISVPAHRYSPLKENWMKLFTPIVEHLHLQIRFNLKNRQVELRTCKDTKDIGTKLNLCLIILFVFNWQNVFFT